jgi:hypothetical protein
MQLSEKFTHLFKSIDPFKQYAPLECPQRLLNLRSLVFVIVFLLFSVYATFNAIAYANTPEPSVATIQKIPSNPNKQLFEFTIMIPMNGTDFFSDDPFPTAYFTPFSSTLTKQKVTPQYISIKTPPEFEFPFLVYECFSFPVYGTTDPVTQSSTILNFFVARHWNEYGVPVLFSVNDDSSPRLENLDYERVFHSSNNSLYPVYRIYQPGSMISLFAMFEEFWKAGTEISIEFTLTKTVTSADVELYKSMFAPPMYSPTTVVPPMSSNAQLKQRCIVVSIRPTVQVITFSPRNILTLIGSTTGVYSTFMAIGGMISGFIWKRLRVQDSKESYVSTQSSFNKSRDDSIEVQALLQEVNSRFLRIQSQMNDENQQRLHAQAAFDARITGIEARLENFFQAFHSARSANRRSSHRSSSPLPPQLGSSVSQGPRFAPRRVITALAPVRSNVSPALAAIVQLSSVWDEEPDEFQLDQVAPAPPRSRSRSVKPNMYADVST